MKQGSQVEDGVEKATIEKERSTKEQIVKYFKLKKYFN